eukprot:CAMPEP_0172456628 /NCGR_PEP_ID=MMETSP1065-20121228/16798_1 /TAXON_ID=265537 /ORGANISM="Amphiprora paludosa, Strain CCMP125" /LENGTH=101 /DNA_ID=CAMNT_0013209777 /DNA_START=59 /DNA_END=361 /DNA_ORIENTATION=-
MWNMLLQVAEGVRDGKRPQHLQAIEERPELYQWIEERIQVLLSMNDAKGEDESQMATSTTARPCPNCDGDVKIRATTATQQEAKTAIDGSSNVGDLDFIAY